jgi:molybdopterin-guanine dinucleotide biosynthesis protein A
MYYAAVLAGGLSSRMGQDKSSLVLHGQTLLERSIRLLKSAGAEVVLISGKAEGYRSVPDLLPRCGPPGGLYSILDHIRATYGLDGSPVLLIPVDMPLLSVATLQNLLDCSANATCCHYDGEVFPCVLKATPDLYCHLRDLFAEGTELGGRRSMKAIMNFVGAKVVPIDTQMTAEFRNVNTPEDWIAIETDPELRAL